MSRLILVCVLVGAVGCGMAAAAAVSGSGAFTYTHDPSRVQLPPEVAANIANAHGLVRDLSGRIYLTYQSKTVTNNTRALCRWQPDGTSPEIIGDPFLAQGTPHGLRHSVEDGKEFLYHANNDVRVHKTDLDGNIIWTSDFTDAWTGTPYFPFKPTNSVLPPKGAASRGLYVTDGYGRGYQHVLNGANGIYSGISFGGIGNSTNPPLYHTPHGINYDPRVNSLVVSDRANNRLVWLTMDGVVTKTKPMPQSLSLPCNVDFGFDNEHALVANLGSFKIYTPAALNNGTVGVLDSNNDVISVIEVAKELGAPHLHPHDNIFLANGDIVVCTWLPGAISYWKRTPTV